MFFSGAAVLASSHSISESSANFYAACESNGWTLARTKVGEQDREFFWKEPLSGWKNGVILIFHGGGGLHYQFCATGHVLVDPQVRFAEKAVQRGFAVFVLDSTDKVTDREGRLCGKVWDDEVRNRENLDLPFVHDVMTQSIPQYRPAGSSPSIFLTGVSSGGYMAVRVASEFPDLVTAFAPISSGDPYGWHRVCIPKKNGRKTVHGAGLDNDTGKEILVRNSCDAGTQYVNEMQWPQRPSQQKPVFKLFHHAKDGVNDLSCNDRVRAQLLAHGFPEEERFLIQGGWRRFLNHFWKDEYADPILDFFVKHSAQ